MDQDVRHQLARQGRLWLLSLVCATAGALAVWQTDSQAYGILAFLAAVAALGPILWAYERSRGSHPRRKSP